jgi:pimeloyl-ACP methyl ester carboxylesterase
MTFKKIINASLKIFLSIALFILIILTSSFVLMTARESSNIETAHPLQGQLIDTGDGSIFVQDAGPKDGPTIFLIHGTGAWSDIWRETIDFLIPKGFRVVALDVPPFGYSEKLDGAASYTSDRQANRFLYVINHLKLHDVTLICHSVGCRAAIESVLIDPKPFGKMILVDAALGFSANSATPTFQQNAPSQTLKTIFSPTYFRDSIIGLYGSSPYSIKPIFSSFVYNKESVSDERLEMLKRPLSLKNMTRSEGDWLQNLSMEEDHSLYTDYNNLRKINVPTLIIWGEKDDVTPLWQGKKLASFIPNSQLVTIPNTGHIPYIEDAVRFHGTIIKFIEK